jgi:hypothetical protein
LAYIINLATAWSVFHAVLDPFKNLPTKIFWEYFIDIAFAANLSITLTCTVFPFIHMWTNAWILYYEHLGEMQKATKMYAKGEIYYIFASFVSKTALVASIGYVSLNREDNK